MKLYFFDIDDGRSSRDDEGTALADIEAVRTAIVELLGQSLSDRGGKFWDDPEMKVTDRDEDDLTLMRLTVFGTVAPACR